MITYGFFNSVNGDRKYNAEDMSHYFEGLISDGIFETIGDRFLVTAGEGMTVTVGTGRALIDCHWIKNDAALSLSLDPADVQLPRKDAIVIKLDLNDSARQMSIEIIKGTPVFPAETPIITNTENVKYLLLAVVTINKGITSIQQNYITDYRGSVKCPWVTGIVDQVNTADLFLQYQTAYETMRAEMEAWQIKQHATYAAWFNQLTSTLSVNTKLICEQGPLIISTDGEDVIFTITGNWDDVLLVFVNGVLFTERVDYTRTDINGGTTGDLATIRFIKPLNKGDMVTQAVIKSVIDNKDAFVANASYVTTTPDEQIVAGVASYEEVTE